MFLGLIFLVLAIATVHRSILNNSEDLQRRSRERLINEVLWLEELKISNPAIYKKVTESNE